MAKIKKQRRLGSFVYTRWFNGLVSRARPRTINDEPDWEALPKLLTIREAAKILHVHPNTLRLWDRRGMLSSVRLGARRDRRYEVERVRNIWSQSRGSSLEVSLERWMFRRELQRKLKQRFVRPVILGTASLAVLLAVGSLHFAQAGTPSRQTTILAPASCSGWNYADRATAVDLTDTALTTDFTAKNSAHYDASAYRTHSISGEVSTATLDYTSDVITCRGFSTAKIPTGTQINASIVVSMVTRGGQNAAGVFAIQTSTDGATWVSQKTVAADASSSTRHTIDLHTLGRDAINTLQVRIVPDVEVDAVDVVADLDGIQLRVETQTSTPAQRRRQRQVQQQLDPLIETSKQLYTSTEDPVVTIPKKQVEKFLFVPIKETAWQLKSVTAKDSRNHSADVTYRQRDVPRNGSTDTDITLDAKHLHPGKYTLRITMVNDSGVEATVDRDLLWGVLVMDFVRPSPRLGDQETVALGVLNDAGVTICDAAIEVKISDPRGGTATYTTKKEITRSDTCVDQGVTNAPDYHFSFPAAIVGTYHLAVTATTPAGVRRLEDNLFVTADNAFDVQRIDYPSRIYPPSPYTAAVAVTARRTFAGVISEFVPRDFEISSTFPQADVVEDAAHQQWRLDWTVSLAAGETTQLHYTFKAPEISPAVFRTGPLLIASNSLAGNDYVEPRQWQIASDSTGANNAGAVRAYSTGFELQSTTAYVEYTANINTPAIDTTTHRSGAASLRTYPTTSTQGMEYKITTSDDAANGDYVRAYVYVASAPSTQTSVMVLRSASAGGDEVSVRMNTDLTLELWNDEQTAQVGPASTAIVLNTWTRIELGYAWTTTLVARLDGVEFAADRAVGNTYSINTLRLGVLTTNASADLYWDDVAVNQDPYGVEVWPGDGKLAYLRPNGNGSNTNWTGDYTAVDETTPNDATDYINCSGNVTEDYDITDSATAEIGATDIIKSMSLNVRFSSSATGSHNFMGRLLLNGSNTSVTRTYNSTSWFTDVALASSNMLPLNTIYDLPGNSLVSITPSDLDSTQVQLTTSSCTVQARISTVWVIAEYVQAEGGRVYSSGFENQSVTAGVEWTAVDGSPTISTGTKRSGAAALRISSLSSTTRQALDDTFKAADANGPFFARAYLNIATAPLAATENSILDFRDSSNAVRAYVTLDGSRQLRLYDEDGVIGSASSALSTATWYRIEVKIDGTGSGANDTVEGKIDGTNFATSATRDLSTGVSQFGVGGNLNGESLTTGDWFFDDVAINQNYGSLQNGYPGAGKIVHLRPNAAGNTDGWTLNPATCSGASNSYECLDEVIPNDATDYLSDSAGVGNAVSYEMNVTDTATAGIASSDPITLAQVGLRFANSDATAQTVTVQVRDGNNFIDSPSIITNTTSWNTNAVAAPNAYPLTVYTRPEQSAILTATSLDSTQIGAVYLSNGIDTYISSEWLLVEYNPPAGIVVSGNIYTNASNETTGFNCASTTLTIKVSVNGATGVSGDCTANPGTYSITTTSAPAAGDPVVIYIDSVETEKATTVTLATDATSAITANLIQDRVVVQYENAGPMTNTKMKTGDNTDAGIRYSVATSGTDNLTVESGMELHVLAGKTFTPGGTVTTNATGGDFHVSGTATIDTATSTIGSDIIVPSGGTLNVNANTTISGGDITVTSTGAVTTTSGTPTVTMGATGAISGTGNVTFYNLATSGTGTTTFSASGTNTINNNVSVGAGTTVNLNSTIAITGSLTNTTSGIIGTSAGTPTVTVQGANIGGGSGAITFYNLTKSGAGSTTFSGDGTNTITNTLAVSAGTLVAPTALSVAKDINFTGGTFTHNSGTITLNGAAQQTITTNTQAFNALTLNNTGTDGTTADDIVISGTLDVNGALTVTNGQLRLDTNNPNVLTSGAVAIGASGSVTKGSGTWTFDGSGTSTWTDSTASGGQDLGAVAINGTTKTINLGSDAKATTLNIAASQTFGLGSSGYTFTLTGSGTVAGTEPYLNSGTLNEGTNSTFKFTGTTATDIEPETFWNLTIAPSGGAGPTYVLDPLESASPITVSGNLIIGDGINSVLCNFNTLAPIIVAGNVTVDTNATLATSTDTSDSFGGSFTNNGTWDGGTNVVFNSTAVGKTLSGNLTGANTILAVFDGVGGGWTINSNAAFQNLTLTNGAITQGENINLIVLGNVSLASGTTFTKASGSGTVTFAGTTATTYTDSTATPQNLGAVTITKTNGTASINKVTLVSSMTVDTLTISASNTLDLANAGYTLLVNGTTATATPLVVSGTLTPNSSSTVKFAATYASGNITVPVQTYASLDCSPTATETCDISNDLTVSDTLTVGSNGTVDIASGKTVTLSKNSATSFVLNGATSGSGTLAYQNSATTVTTSGTLSSGFTFDMVNGSQTIPNRTFGGLVTVLNTTSSARTAQIASSSTPTFTGLDLKTTGTGTVLFDAATNNPTTVTITGSVTNSAANGAVTLSMGSGSWAVSGSYNLTNITTLNHNSGKLVMAGTGTLTSNGKTLNNLDINSSGTVTLAGATHTLAGNLLLGGSGTPTVTGSTISMVGSGKTITGGGKTLESLTLDGGGTTTLQTSDLTVSGTLNVTTNDTLSIASGMTHTGGTFTFPNTATISGSGTLLFTSASPGPGTTGTLSPIVRFDATSGDIAAATVDGRTYGGRVELLSTSSSNRAITLPSETFTLSGGTTHLYIQANGTGDLTVEGGTNSPTMNVGGDLKLNGTGGGNEVLAMGDGTWTVSGNVDFSQGFAAPHVAQLNPTWDNFGYSQDNYEDDGGGGCTFIDTVYSCGTASATSMNTGANNQTGGGQDCSGATTDTSSRAYVKYDLSSISNTYTVSGVQQQVYVTSAGTAPIVGRAGSDTPNTAACSDLHAVGIASADNGFASWSTGTQVASLSTTNAQAALGSSAFALVFYNGSTQSTITSTDSATNKPVLRIGYYVPSTSPTLIMNGTSVTLTASGPQEANFYNLTLSGTVTVGLTSTIKIFHNFDLSGTVTNNTAPLVMTGVASGATLSGHGNTIGNMSITDNGNVTLDSSLTLSLNLVVYTGATLTIASGQTLTHTATISNSGTITGSGLLTMTAASTGPGATGTLSVPVRFDATSGNIATTTLDARTYGAAVEFYDNSASAHTITAPTGTFVYSGAVTTTEAGAGSLLVELNTNDPTGTISGALTIGAGTTLSANSANNLNVNGNYTNNGTFTDNSGTVTLAGLAQQTLGGTMTGSSDFNNLIITNASGNDPDSSPSVIFGAAFSTAGTFTAVTANTKLRFAAGTTSTPTAINLNGQSTGTRVTLRSSTPGTVFLFNAGAGSRTVMNTSVKDSNACGSSGGEIDASDGTNVDLGNNPCWTILKLTVSLSPTTSVSLGTLIPTAVNQSSLTSTVTTNAPNGYVSTALYNNTLTATGGTIADTVGGTVAAGESEFGASTDDSSSVDLAATDNSCATGAGPYNATALSTTAQVFASETAPITGKVNTLCFVASTIGTQVPGSYSSTVTLVTTGKF